MPCPHFPLLSVEEPSSSTPFSQVSRGSISVHCLSLFGSLLSVMPIPGCSSGRSFLPAVGCASSRCMAPLEGGDHRSVASGDGGRALGHASP